MIGLLNVPCDTPAEYYSAAPNHVSSSSLNHQLSRDLSSLDKLKNLKLEKNNTDRHDFNIPQSSSPDLALIFNCNHGLRQTNYLNDGRQVCNGELFEVIIIITFLIFFTSIDLLSIDLL